MQSFIHQILSELTEKASFKLENTCFVLPSKRSGQFLKNELKTINKQTGFAPIVLSTEEFIEDITGLQALDHTQSLFAFYKTYRQLTPQEKLESFDVFYGWAQNLLYDFNEIDRYLIDAEDLFNYLSKIQDLKHWSAPDNQTELIKNYLNFWHKQPEYYRHFKQSLLSENKAYQGLMYRVASEKISGYLRDNYQEFIFLGFNALNNAEQQIIKTILKEKRGQIYWDLDTAFFNDQYHEAGLFLRKYFHNWDIYQNDPDSFQKLSHNYSEKKNISIIGVAKNIGQAKTVGKILRDLPQEELKQTAIVLSDETLLMPLLNSLPDTIESVNITMGLPLSQTPLAPVIETLFEIQLRGDNAIYYKPILDILSAPGILEKTGQAGRELRHQILTENKVYLKPEAILKDHKDLEILRYCLSLQQNPIDLLEQFENLMLALKPEDQNGFLLQTEYLFHFNKLFKKLKNLLQDNTALKSVRGLYKVYRDALQTESLDFEGSPFSGLQIMGMLETRSLNFKNLILTSVNEGVLPAGKSQNTFIPYDLKKEYGLPTYREKDAVYTYHFYRLIQRAENVHLLYNSHKSGLNGGEPSRFIQQLEIEAPHFSFNKQTALSRVPGYNNELQEIEKDGNIMSRLHNLAKSGFSPSALTTYIRNPIDFYRKYIHGIRDAEEVEETVAFNTLGTVVHNALENLHRPFLKKELNSGHLEVMRKSIEKEVETEFEKEYGTAYNYGKNRLIYEVAKRYVYNFLNVEQAELKSGPIILQSLEKEYSQNLVNKFDNIQVKLKGKLDRVDYYNGILRIIDYKTGKVNKADLNVKDWSQITSDYKFSKAFQVLCYAYLLKNTITENQQVNAGIFSFKNLNSGFLNFQYTGTESEKSHFITKGILANFEEQLTALIDEILNPNITFKEKIV